MIVVKDNPLTDLHALRKIDMVVMNGKIYKSPKVKKLKDVEIELDKQ